MSVSLREVIDTELGVDTSELIEDQDVLRFYRKAVNWYRKYRLFPRANTYNYSIESGDYVPDILLDKEIVYKGVTKKLGDIVDSQTRIFNGTGTIQVVVALTSNNAYLAGLPHELESLFAAYCRQQIGERLAFSKYPSQPFDIDAEYWKSKGADDIDKWEKFIMENRDEDPENITDLRAEAYAGTHSTIFMMKGTTLW